MKRTILITAVVCLTLALALPALAQPAESDDDYPGYYGGGMMGYGPGMMGYGGGMMRGGGPGMMGYGHGRGMMGGGRGMMGGWGQGYQRGDMPDYPGWRSMTPEQRQQWQKMRAKFMEETLPLRQEMSSKHMALVTEWNKPEPDQDKVRELSKDVRVLQGKLQQKRDEFLQSCRSEFGDKGWSCPGAGMGGPAW